MTESVSDMPEEKEAANMIPICGKQHCKEMRKDKLPPYLRDRGMSYFYTIEKKVH